MKNGLGLDARHHQGVQSIDPLKGQLPPQLKITPLSDQSIFVRGSINGVVREAIIAACLTAIMILVFLGSWRSTSSLRFPFRCRSCVRYRALSMLGETINIMTLGGWRWPSAFWWTMRP